MVTFGVACFSVLSHQISFLTKKLTVGKITNIYQVYRRKFIRPREFSANLEKSWEETTIDLKWRMQWLNSHIHSRHHVVCKPEETSACMEKESPTEHCSHSSPSRRRHWKKPRMHWIAPSKWQRRSLVETQASWRVFTDFWCLLDLCNTATKWLRLQNVWSSFVIPFLYTLYEILMYV